MLIAAILYLLTFPAPQLPLGRGETPGLRGRHTATSDQDWGCSWTFVCGGCLNCWIVSPFFQKG